MKITAISILVAAVLIVVAIVLTSNGKDSTNISSSEASSNVSVIGGKQVVTINAKGGYAPRVTTAKADIPTVIKMDTNGTFDCSSVITIPSLGYQKNMPPSGETEIDVPAQKAGSTIRGICAMGMYSFAVQFI